MTTFNVYIPKHPESPETKSIAAGSAIVGQVDEEFTTIYYEGFIHGGSHDGSFELALLLAAGRMQKKYPTVAFERHLNKGFADFFIKVGEFDYESRDLIIAPEFQALFDAHVARFTERTGLKFEDPGKLYHQQRYRPG